MYALVFRHVPFEDIGLIGPALESRGIELRYADLYTNPDAVIDWNAAGALVSMGGPMSANDDLPWLRREISILRAALAAGKPILGVCLGSQLLARAAGAAVYRNPVKEIGWAELSFTPATAGDALFHGFDRPEPVFHWHGETFDLPAGAEWLACSEKCRNQVYRLGSSAYGLQCHLEVTPEMISSWCREDANAVDVRERTEPIEAEAHSARLAEIAGTVFGRWADLVRTAVP